MSKVNPYQIELNFEEITEQQNLSFVVSSPSQHYKYVEEHLCPICSKPIKRSDYLSSVFGDKPLVEWIANLITHYRHNHISSWNKCWQPGGGRYRAGWFGDYEKEKAKVNERAKRQLIRQAYPIFLDVGIRPYHFEQLKNTTAETMAVANKHLK